MKRRLAVLFVLFPLIIPARVFAKADISKITIKGAHLKIPIEITDPKTLAHFNVWSGPGSSWSGGKSPPTWVDTFSMDWFQDVTEHPKGLQRYEVSCYAKLPNERLIYVVFYEYDPSTEHGYIYLPGRTDEWYRLNVGTIYRDVEGLWFRASSEWDSIARELIANAKAKT
jgi:hypothetical protein